MLRRIEKREPAATESFFSIDWNNKPAASESLFSSDLSLAGLVDSMHAQLHQDDPLSLATKASCVLVGVWILYVWTFRAFQKTDFRAGNATTLREEMRVYGLPDWAFYFVGFCKVSLACCLLFAAYADSREIAFPAALGMGFLMVVAIKSHVQILSDPLSRNGPALVMLILSTIIVNETCPDQIQKNLMNGVLATILVVAVLYGYCTGHRIPDDDRDGYHRV